VVEVSVSERYCAIKLEIVGHIRIEVVVAFRIAVYALNLGRCKIRLPTSAAVQCGRPTVWLVVDDPVIECGLLDANRSGENGTSLLEGRQSSARLWW